MKISIALCTFNGMRYINDQLYSILNQTYPVNEIIICDDASNDDTLKMLEDFKVKFPRMIYIYKNPVNMGTLRNFENAISLTTGDIIFLSDQDDIWKENKVEKIIKLFRSSPNALMIFSNGNIIDENGKYLGYSLWEKWEFNKETKNKWKNNILAFSDLIRNNNKVTGATVAFKKKLKKQVIPFNVPVGYWHDAWIALHAAALNGLLYIDESLIDYRVHKEQQIGLPTSVRRNVNHNNFNESISYQDFILLIIAKFPKLFH